MYQKLVELRLSHLNDNIQAVQKLVGEYEERVRELAEMNYGKTPADFAEDNRRLLEYKKQLLAEYEERNRELKMRSDVYSRQHYDDLQKHVEYLLAVIGYYERGEVTTDKTFNPSLRTQDSISKANRRLKELRTQLQEHEQELAQFRAQLKDV